MPNETTVEEDINWGSFKDRIPHYHPSNRKQSKKWSTGSALELILSSVSANQNMPLSGCNISFVMSLIHSLSNPPASLTYSSHEIIILTFLCQLIPLMAPRVLMRKLSLEICNTSAPFCHGIRRRSNYNLNHSCLIGNSIILI